MYCLQPLEEAITSGHKGGLEQRGVGKRLKQEIQNFKA